MSLASSATKMYLLQHSSDYRCGNNVHIHPPRADQLVKTRIQKAIQSMASADVFRSAQSIVQEALQDNVDATQTQPVDAIPTLHSMVSCL